MSSHTNNNANTNNSNDNYLGERDHEHKLKYAGISQTHCVIKHFYSCADRTCGYWEEGRTEIDVSCCNLLVTRYSTRVTCYECSECGRKEQDRS
jgi:hypothetical protein